MTLLVAAIEDGQIWMVADTAISGGQLSLRDRKFEPKIRVSLDGLAIGGFAGDFHHGSRLLSEACAKPAGKTGLDALLAGHLQYPSVEFAYGYYERGLPQLVLVSDGRAREVPTLHIGLADAFDAFQRIRHDSSIDAYPLAAGVFIVAAREKRTLPSGLPVAIQAMLHLFAEGGGPEIGGWAVPYLLGPDKARFVTYAYSLSDPILGDIKPGSIVPHGTAEAGGFGLSVTELGENEGIVVYWLQKPGGVVFMPNPAGFEARMFEGAPTTFKETASAALNRPVEIWFGDKPPTNVPNKISIMRDKSGEPGITIADHGDTFTIAINNTATPFEAEATLAMADQSDDETDKAPIRAHASNDKKTITLEFNAGSTAANVILNAVELDAFIKKLGMLRADMTEPVVQAPDRTSNTTEMVAIDPKWLTNVSPHPSLPGILLRLRHLGLGWTTFLLPMAEAQALGKWLADNSRVVKQS